MEERGGGRGGEGEGGEGGGEEGGGRRGGGGKEGGERGRGGVSVLLMDHAEITPIEAQYLSVSRLLKEEGGLSPGPRRLPRACIA